MPDRPSTSHWDNISSTAGEILNVREEVAKHRSPRSTLIERVGRTLARPAFFAALVASHLLWIVLNLPIYPYEPWDPYPFTFLATLTSVESPFFMLLVLMHQQRETHINELREETELQVSLHTEREVSMALRLLHEMQRQLDVETDEDPELIDRLQSDLDPQQLMENLREELRREEGGSTSTAP